MNRSLKYYFKDVLSYVLYPGLLQKRKKYTLTIFCVIKEENEYLEEWIKYYLKLGVEHFCIFNNESKTPVGETLASLKLNNVSTVTIIKGQVAQLKAYNLGTELFGKETQWMAFIGTDEFLVPKNANNLQQFLHAYRKFGGLGVNWLVFGSSGHEKNQRDHR